MAFSLRCPVCRTKFPWVPTEGFPEICPNEDCNSRIAHDRADDDIVMPAFRSIKTAAHDQLYREMEAASERRAEQAAELSGAPVEEMAGLKITDLAPARHEGDVAAPSIAHNLAALGVRDEASLFKGSNGSEYSGAVQTGPHPNAGARMRTALQAHHGQISGGSAVSDRPAVETAQPGYRRRG